MKRLQFVKSKLKEWNKDAFRDMEEEKDYSQRYSQLEA